MDNPNVIRKFYSYFQELPPKQIREFVFKIELYMALVVCIGFLIFSNLFGFHTYEFNIIFLFTACSMLIAYGLLRLGHFKRAVWSYMILGAAAITVASLLFPASKLEGLFYYLVAVTAMLFLGKNNKSLIACLFFCAMGTLCLMDETFYQTPGEANLSSDTLRRTNILILLIFFVEGVFKALFYALVETKSAASYRSKKVLLEESESKLQDIFDNIYDGIVIIDDKGFIVNCNKAARNLLEVDTCEKLHITDLVFPEDAEKSQYYLNLLETQGYYTGYQGRIISRKGNIKYVEVNSVAITDENGKLVGSRDIVRDITVKKNHEKLILQKMEELNAKNLELKKYIDSNIQLENFAYLASHDLKAPTRTIKSFAQLLERSLKDKLNQDEKEYFGFINNAASYMGQLIDDLLAYSLVDKQDYQFTKANLSEEIDIVLATLHTSIVDAEAKIFVHNVPKELAVDVTFIKQLFQNLIANAIKFRKADTPPVIVVNTKEEEDRFVFSIADNGIGIKKEFHEEIFKLFRKLNAPGKYGGTGIGLAMCSSIVKEHGGEIWVESEYGKGTTFYFSISKNLQASNLKGDLLPSSRSNQFSEAR